ncbi:ABC transporter substrate-binding protein [Gordonia sp. SID5947]|uniref:ABC transporter substrate-binding protein n=1 Tax=Gordonia sp. SID5947 TaxID=2690315 RepID=UPI00136BD9BD|nr:ABC transporter substrate-binding protein [Gordonia sp. SID5947]MYR06894.1 ABC transporter substrate-binding protein [Gordonia sp. SID5947]
MKTVRRPYTTRIIAAAAAAVLFASVSACSSDDDPESASSSAAVPSDAFPGKAAAGAPVRIGLIANEGGQAMSLPETREAAEAATKYANENLGGIAGRPIELVICKEQEDPVSARNCANQMVEQKVPAVVVTNTGLGSVIAPIITKAGIPYITALGGSPAEINSDNSYVWTAGSNTSQAMARFAKEQGMKSVVAYSIDSPAATGSLTNIGGPAFRAAGMDFKLITIPFGTADATPQVSAGLDANPDGVLVYGESTVCTSVLKALNTLGSKAIPISPQTCAAPEVVQAVGATGMENLRVFSSADTVSDDPESVLYRTIMKKYSPDTPTQGYAVTGYQGMLGLVRATAGLTGDVTPESVGTAIKKAQKVELPAGDGITFTCDGTAIPGLKSLCGDTMIVLTMKDGELTDPTKVSVSKQ